MKGAKNSKYSYYSHCSATIMGPAVPSAVQARDKAKVPSAKSLLSCLVTDLTGE